MGAAARYQRGLVAAGLLLAAEVLAQEPAPAPPPAPDPPAQPPIDPAKAAAELLRRRLGLQPGPVGEPPPGPPAPEPGTEAAGAAGEAQQPQPGAVPPGPDAGAPAVQQPGAPVDPAEAARRALQRLMPEAAPPAVGPSPEAAGAGGPAPPRQAPPPAPTGDQLPIGGILSLTYRMRHGAGFTDQDLVGRLGVDVGDVRRDPVSFHLRARGFVNLDGFRDDDQFIGLDHSFGDNFHGRLYGAHLDMRSVPGLSLLRLGRQDLDETPVPLSFDGVRADTIPVGGPTSLWLTGYGGIPVHHFEASSRGDSVFGAGAGFVPWQAARVRVDFMSLRDEFLAIDRAEDVFGVRWWQALGILRWNGLHTWVDGRPRDFVVTCLGQIDDRTDFRASYRGLLSTQAQQVTELDPFYEVALEYSPFRQIEVAVTRDLGDRMTASIGADVRRLEDRGMERAFNREFERYYADLTWRDIGVEGLWFTLVGSVWNSSGESYRALTGELQYRPDAWLRVVLGAGYDLFRYDPLQDRERLNVRSAYLRVDRRLSERLRLEGGYELQTDDFDEFHILRVTTTWIF